MQKPSPAQMDAARRLLAYESGGKGEEQVAAAVRVYEKLCLQFATLLGAVAVQVLLKRSAKMTSAEFPGLAESAAGGSATKLREYLQAQEPVTIAAAAEALFAAFLTLITTFVGEQLTAEVLRRAWPALQESAPKETKK
jgi:hypothetical protein